MDLDLWLGGTLEAAVFDCLVPARRESKEVLRSVFSISFSNCMVSLEFVVHEAGFREVSEFVMVVFPRLPVPASSLRSTLNIRTEVFVVVVVVVQWHVVRTNVRHHALLGAQ